MLSYNREIRFILPVPGTAKLFLRFVKKTQQQMWKRLEIKKCTISTLVVSAA